MISNIKTNYYHKQITQIEIWVILNLIVHTWEIYFSAQL